THAHVVRCLSKLNLRECYHLLKLRSASNAHFTIRDVANQMRQAIEETHPLLLKYVPWRD
ncbi:MAG: FAD-dependent thymidylate synthase, partial [Chloroflexi bacterium]|nr:FAD-dependent thymidylate synthase [Chloroflexota bacterium]